MDTIDYVIQRLAQLFARACIMVEGRIDLAWRWKGRLAV